MTVHLKPADLSPSDVRLLNERIRFLEKSEAHKRRAPTKGELKKHLNIIENFL